MTTTQTAGTNTGVHGREIRGTSPANRQGNLLTPSALFLGSVGRSQSNISNRSLSIRVDPAAGPSRGSSLSPPPFLANLRRSSDSSDNGNGSNSLTISGLARRIPGSEITAMEVERNHLLRSVSHLSKDQTAPEPIRDRADIFDQPIDRSTPFTRFDLLPPPEYEQKIRQPKKPAYGVRGGVRGRSYSDGRRSGYPSTSMTTQEYLESLNGTNHSGFSHAYKGGSGKAKAIFPAAAAKLRKLSMSNLGNRKVSVSTPIGEENKANGIIGGGASSSKNLKSSVNPVTRETEQSAMPSNTNLTSSHDLSNSNRDFGVSNDQVAIAPDGISMTRGLNGIHDDNIDFSTSNEPTQFGIKSIENLNTNSTQLFKSEKSQPNFIFTPRQFNEHMADPPEGNRSTTIWSDQDFTASSASNDQETSHRDAGCARIDAAPLRSDSAIRVGEDYIIPPQRSEVNSSIAPRKTSLSSTRTARDSLPTSATQPEIEIDPEHIPPDMMRQSTSMSSTGMTEFDSPIAESRRGSAPVEIAGRRKSAFRLGGMMKLNGSNIDVNSLENKITGRRGSHLEGSHQRQPSEDAVSNASSRSHRLSFSSLNRPRQSHDGTRSTTFNLLSKFNGTREQLSSPTIEDDSVTSRDSTEKSLKKADAKLSTRQFILNAFRKPSLSQVAMTTSNESASLSPTTHHTTTMDSSSNSGSQDSVSTEATENVFTAAFGTPQRSDLLSGQAFEGKGNGVNGEEGEVYNRRLIRHGEGPTTRSSRDSTSTSFFSIAEGSQSREAGTPLFDRSHSFTRSTGDQLSRTNSAMLLAADPLAEEGPLGESLYDETVIQDTSTRGKSKLTKPSSRDGSSIGEITSAGPVANATVVSDAITAPQRSLGLDEEQNISSRVMPVDGNEHLASLGVVGASSHTSSNAVSTRRPGRSSHLSHMPRLDSMRVIKRTSSTGESEQGRDRAEGGESSHIASGESAQRQSDEHEHTSDTDTGDDTHEGEDEVTSETESEGITDGSGDESEADTSAYRSSSMSDALSSQSIVNSAASTRSRPGDISLPPVPTFGNGTDTTLGSSAVSPFAIAAGEDTWTRFDSAFTPFETPAISATPTLANLNAPISVQRAAAASSSSLSTARNVAASNAAASADHTPNPTTEASNSSYFDILPSQNRSTGMVPPSPSVITRSRATSSVSKRSLRSPSRELPPLPPITPMQIKSLEAFKAGSNRVTGPISLNTSAFENKNASTPTIIARPVSIASPQDLSNGAEPSNRRAADMYNTAMPLPVAPNGTMSSAKRKQNSSRPSLYQQQSRSLIDLSTLAASRQTRDDDLKPPPTPLLYPISNKDGVAPETSQDSSTVQSPNASLTPASSSNALRRRRSMFEVGAVPPPYAIIHKRPEGPQMIFPREEEGKEALPGYSCAVHIEGYLPRKMEFSSPGVQAKDRSWRRQYFVLHGTCLKVYKSDLSGENLIGKGAWGEVVQGVHVHTEPMNEDGPINSTASTTGNIKDGSALGSSHHGKDASNAANSNGHHSQGGNSGLNAAVEVVNSLTGSFHIGNRTGLLKTYSLQGAESGLAADYLKRRHVVRVRVEGEQFLLQTRNDRHVVDWIEAFQAATNVSLDLERRPMPKFITLPRRRRRRRRGAEGAGTGGPVSAANQEAFDLEEARRRSLIDAGGANMSRSPSSRLPPARPLGLPGDESPDPSAAFDDMLREDQDDLMRRDATTM